MIKIKKVFLAWLIILVIAGLIYVLPGAIYSVVPKYQIYTIRVNDNLIDVYDRVLIIKLNTLTGETDSWYEQYDPNPSNKLKIRPIR